MQIGIIVPLKLIFISSIRQLPLFSSNEFKLSHVFYSGSIFITIILHFSTQSLISGLLFNI